MLLLIASCATAVRPPSTTAMETPAEPGVYRASFTAPGRVYAIDPAQSALHIYVFRGGRAARLGHNHVISAPRLRGQVLLPGDDPAQAQFSLALRFDELEIDDPALRTQTGAHFGGARSAGDIEGTRRNLLKSLDAARYPEVVVNSAAISGDWPMLVADIVLSLHGQSRQMSVPLHVERDEAGLLVTGAFAIRQSDFGIKPYSVLGGLLAVQDAVAIDFTLRAISSPP